MEGGLARYMKGLHNTFPLITSSSSLSIGTGTPHLRSRVKGVGISPALTRASTISPSELITEFGDHFPSLDRRFIHSSVRGCILSSFIYMWVEILVVTTCVLSTRHRGLINSTASSVLPQLSHWSPRASCVGVRL